MTRNLRLTTLLRAASLAMALAFPAASNALAASAASDTKSLSAPEQMAKSPVSSNPTTILVAPSSPLRNGAGLVIDPVYGIPVPGQSLGGY